ncbi:hypothetical protein T265_08854 [Opisthorchis viverrini]|uniref:Uncharacterized protein n=1 Tax=Opisthorchis viverrini TaxID=6198 RepID=A0A074Z7Y5_OPIVI|nr:hypothetical protein T265_08854 [Opisthorchis viverrini]KER23203.1 hypothetical protein T265_08854 [Opisthorchis viverrini]
MSWILIDCCSNPSECYKATPQTGSRENIPLACLPISSFTVTLVISRVPKTLKSPKKELSAFLAFVEKVFNVMESDPSVEWRQVLKQIRLIRLCLSPASIAGRDGVQAKKKFDRKHDRKYTKILAKGRKPLLLSCLLENVISRVPKTLESPKKELSAFLAFVEKVFNVMESDPSVEWRQVLKQIRLIRLCLSPASIAGRDGVQAKKKFDHRISRSTSTGATTTSSRLDPKLDTVLRQKREIWFLLDKLQEFMNIRKFFEEQSGLIVQTVLKDDETGPFSQADIELMFREVVYSAPRDIIWEYLSRCKIVPKTKEMKQLLFASAGIRVDKQSGSFNQISSTADTHGCPWEADHTIDKSNFRNSVKVHIIPSEYRGKNETGTSLLLSTERSMNEQVKQMHSGQQQQHWVGCLDSESAYHIHHPKHELSSSVSSVTTLVNELSQQNGPDDLKYKPSVHVTTSIRDIINERQTNGASIDRSISTKSLQPAESTSFSWPVGEIFVPSRKHAQSHPDEVIKVVDFSMHAHSEPCSAPENQDYRYVTKENGTKYHVVDRNSGKPLKYTEAIATNMRCAQKHTTKSDG